MPGPRTKILDPQGALLGKFNQIFVLSCVISVSIDPLFFYILIIDDNKKCIGVHRSLEIIVSALRTFIDIFYLLKIIFEFRTGFFGPSSRVFGTGEAVTDPGIIAKRYMSSYFMLDVLSVLPLPQVIPFINRHHPMTTKDTLRIVILVQYVPRFARIFPLFKQVANTSGTLTETAWAGAAFNLFLYMLASHVIGAFWYLFSIEQVEKCWGHEFNRQNLSVKYLHCNINRANNPVISNLDLVNLLNKACPYVDPGETANSTTFKFGISSDALTSGVVQSLDFPFKFFYCFWWGLSNLSSLGQNLKPGSFVGEIVFEVFISISGLILFSLLIGNMQKYLESISVRIEEMRAKRDRIRRYEQWMAHRMLPEDLKQRVRRYEQYEWQETRGVEEENLLRNLPKDLRRDINCHLCLALLRRVPLFEKIDTRLLDTLCERLKPILYTEGSYIIRKGDPVDEMLFITRGALLSMTDDGGISGFFNSTCLKAGDFFGEELLIWALDLNSTSNLPLSTRTVKALTEVETFAVMPDDLKFVASQIRRFHSKQQLEHTFRFYSQQWRTWAACFIQAAWHRHCKRKLHKTLREAEDSGTGSSSLGTTLYASSFAATPPRGLLIQEPSAPKYLYASI